MTNGQGPRRQVLVLVGLAAISLALFEKLVRPTVLKFARVVVAHQERVRDELADELGRAPTQLEFQARLKAISRAAVEAMRDA